MTTWLDQQTMSRAISVSDITFVRGINKANQVIDIDQYKSRRRCSISSVLISVIAPMVNIPRDHFNDN